MRAALLRWGFLSLFLGGLLSFVPAGWVLAASQEVLSSEPSPAGAPPGEDVLTSRPPPSRPEPPGAPAPGVPPDAAEEGGIRILNGNGVRGYAALWAGRLRAGRFNVLGVGNADRLDHPRTIIYYREGAERMALALRRALGRRGSLKPLETPGPYSVEIVLGRDLLQREDPSSGAKARP